ncbi:SDR family NAD(P)-dependent oxidoreductase [Micromonospora sp. NBC_00421]|uniref:SDR family NAD(P)-dependent oxidoreductase n=1 Tax=Micromonospora sp. NBC_00421 TaxID=2975976 RepID=UPI002E206608
MPTIAIMGAGPGMGLAIAQTFGKEGHQVALLSRTPAKLEPVVAELIGQGIEAAAFAADVTDRPSIVAGLAAVRQRFGQIDVFEYSPSNPALPMAPSTELTHENVQVHLDFLVHGAVAAVSEVLPEMLARGSGTILFTTGATSVRPEMGHEIFGNVGPAAAWLRNWAHGLHAAAAPRGVQVGHVAIGTWLARQPGATAPEEIAPLYWELHTNHDQVEKVFFPNEQPAA